jgi:CNT family concentrative nucleoside transporter
MNGYNLVSGCGLVLLMVLAWVLSANRRLINWRVILWGLLLQLLFALFVFLVPAGRRLFVAVNDLVVVVLESASAGSTFVFGRLAIPPGGTTAAGEPSLGFILAFQALPTIIFFSALMAMLYYAGVMQRLIRGFAFVFTTCMRLSGAESLSAASNIFVGIESALTIRPYLHDMTPSELCTVLTVGMATVASNVLAVYVFSLQKQFPTIAGHLVSASFLSAPAALIMAKLIYPETDVPRTLGTHVLPHYERERNVFEAVINGANTGVRLIVGIVALLVAILGLVALLDLGLTQLGGTLNGAFGWQIDWSLRGLLGYLFYPLTLLLGVPPDDVPVVARIIGSRAVVTEVVAYQDLARAMAQGVLRHPRSVVITTYALCGFAHVASMAIFVGGIAALIPERTNQVAALGFRALVAATLACLMTACIAGLFMTSGATVLGG